MKTQKTTAILFVIGLFIGGSAVAEAGGSEYNNRYCVRQLCYNLRNCEGEGGQNSLKEKADVATDMVSKKSENAQGRPGSCRLYAMYEYMYCAEEGEGIRVKDTPIDKKATDVAPTND